MFPKFVIGGAVFNHQYCENPETLPVKDIINEAFKQGFKAIDTSPYYGPSEELIGNALLQLPYNREEYIICTKAGRIKLNEFDYSRKNIRYSVERSLKRLNTSYLDVVYLHDVEFVGKNEILEALKELELLKQEGIAKNIGISGYPIEFLYEIASEYGKLDCILSYCNGCLQNTKLFQYYDKFKDCGVKYILNGSILSMSLIRSSRPHAFHPGSQELKDKVYEIAQDLLKNDSIELASLSTKYAIENWSIKYNSPIVLGVSNLKELQTAVDALNDTKDYSEYYDRFQSLLGSHFNETWSSGNH
ncbi:unnamed protein product [Candida verbasci]|uniref:NADP-dependent oxidoreductase domain-containing protein n=1 Tax=Candida verbasci TaxID=1227364 RepID=A0A9W4TWE9_9ASCO|nr:unnamed protein product [Candida verbasci]